MDREEAWSRALRFLNDLTPGVRDPTAVGIEEYRHCFVVKWTSVRADDGGDVPNPGVGPIAVPKDGSAIRYLGSQRIDWALFYAGLGPEPGPDPAPNWSC